MFSNIKIIAIIFAALMSKRDFFQKHLKNLADPKASERQCA